MESGFRTAIVGAAGLVGHQLVALLEQRGFAVRELVLVDQNEQLGNLPETSLPARAALASDLEAISDCDIVFLCAPQEASAAWAGRVAGQGVVVDLSGILGEETGVPVVVPEVNPDALGAVTDVRRVVSPAPAVVAGAIVAAPIANAVGLSRVRLIWLEPVSAAGQYAMQEFARQSAELLGGLEPSVEPGMARAGFNCIAGTGLLLEGGCTQDERRVESELRRVLDRPDLNVMATGVRVPTFFGHGLVVDLEAAEEVDAEEIRQSLRGAPGVILMDEAGGRFPGVLDAVDADAVVAGRVRVDERDPRCVRLWAAVEGTRKGGALNAVEIAEILARDYL